MYKKIMVLGLVLGSLSSFAQGTISFNSRKTAEVVRHFRAISKLAMPAGSTAAGTQCGYIFPNDPTKFGCKGIGAAAASDVAAACAGGGELACTGSGANKVCVCAFD